MRCKPPLTSSGNALSQAIRGSFKGSIAIDQASHAGQSGIVSRCSSALIAKNSRAGNASLAASTRLYSPCPYHSHSVAANPILTLRNCHRRYQNPHVVPSLVWRDCSTGDRLHEIQSYLRDRFIFSRAFKTFRVTPLSMASLDDCERVSTAFFAAF